jgi:hypothetical protein
MPETALMLRDQKFAITRFEPEQIHEAIETNLAGEQLTERDLDRITVPAGGGSAFEIVDETGETSNVKAVTGVLIKIRTGRAYWATAIEESGGGAPPDCFSTDGKTGTPMEYEDDDAPKSYGGPCKDCVMNQWGSSDKEKSRGKACKEMRLVYLLQPDSILPSVIIVPPSSLQALKTYTTRLIRKALPFSDVMTEVSLQQAQNQAGIKYSQLVFKKISDLDEQSIDMIRAYTASMSAALEQPMNVSQNEVQ